MASHSRDYGDQNSHNGQQENQLDKNVTRGDFGVTDDAHVQLDEESNTRDGGNWVPKSSTPLAYEKLLYRRFRFLRAFEMLMLLSYETLTYQALQLVNCVNLGGCGTVLAEFPDVSCKGHNTDYSPLKAVAVILLIYAGLFPILLFYKLWKIRQDAMLCCQRTGHGDTAMVDVNVMDENPLTKAKFGVFYDLFMPRFFWWEVQVR